MDPFTIMLVTSLSSLGASIGGGYIGCRLALIDRDKANQDARPIEPRPLTVPR